MTIRGDKMAIDRKSDWEKFSSYMLNHHIEDAQERYALDEGGDNDLLVIVPKKVKLWNIMRYTLRNINDCGKPDDFFKIAHYAQILQTEVWIGNTP